MHLNLQLGHVPVTHYTAYVHFKKAGYNICMLGENNEGIKILSVMIGLYFLWPSCFDDVLKCSHDHMHGWLIKLIYFNNV